MFRRVHTPTHQSHHGTAGSRHGWMAGPRAQRERVGPVQAKRDVTPMWHSRGTPMLDKLMKFWKVRIWKYLECVRTHWRNWNSASRHSLISHQLLVAQHMSRHETRTEDLVVRAPTILHYCARIVEQLPTNKWSSNSDELEWIGGPWRLHFWNSIVVPSCGNALNIINTNKYILNIVWIYTVKRSGFGRW